MDPSSAPLSALPPSSEFGAGETVSMHALTGAGESPATLARRAGDVTRGAPPPADPRRSGLLLTYPTTSILIAINVAIYLLMLPHSPVPLLWRFHQYAQIPTAPFDVGTLMHFGGSEVVAVIAGHQWWRLLTAAFVHASFLHIAVNLWCLWNLGLFGEPLLGRWGLAWVYVLTGVAGNLLSLCWSLFTRTDALVVGASGAIFGIAGILIILLSKRRLAMPWEELRALRRQVVLFAVANLALGLAPQFAPILSPAEWARLHVNPGSLPRIDNTAHLGGFFSGLALGLPLFAKMTTGRASYRRRQRITFAWAALLLSLAGYALAKLVR
ncbi:MAG TPA: rhomboid family intramembrane serine protease [Acidobacteriaceae bacterium]|nr:rhomboid family intramembrane serine protease [Acidobacteriaceae bacterium]